MELADSGSDLRATFTTSFPRPAHSSPKLRGPPVRPSGTVACAIGDIYSRLDLLQPLDEATMGDAAASAAERKVQVFLGD